MSKEQDNQKDNKALHIDDVVPILHRIASCIDEAVENTNYHDEGEWDKICTAVELLNKIAEDNLLFVRN